MRHHAATRPPSFGGERVPAALPRPVGRPELRRHGRLRRSNRIRLGQLERGERWLTSRTPGGLRHARPAVRRDRRRRGAGAEVPQGEHDRPLRVLRSRVRRSPCGCRRARPSEVDFGESEMEPEVTMTMEADTAHRFWLGQVNVTVALARGADQGAGAGREDPQARAADEAGLPALQGAARGAGPRGPRRGLRRRRRAP